MNQQEIYSQVQQFNINLAEKPLKINSIDEWKHILMKNKTALLYKSIKFDFSSS